MKKNLRILLSSIATTLTLTTLVHGSEKLEGQPYAQTKPHLALVVEDIEKTRDFYASTFQLPFHEGKTPAGKHIYAFEIGPMVIAFNEVPNFPRDGVTRLTDVLDEELVKSIRETHFVPSLHFGLFHLTPVEFDGIIGRLQQNKAQFIMPRTVINPNTDHEQMLAFAVDPNGYVIEIRSSEAKRGFRAKEFEQQDQSNVKITK